jgi:hypothetical protein
MTVKRISQSDSENSLLEHYSESEDNTVLDTINSAKEKLSANQEEINSTDQQEISERNRIELFIQAMKGFKEYYQIKQEINHQYSIKEDHLSPNQTNISLEYTINSDQQQLTNEQQEELYQANKDF